MIKIVLAVIFVLFAIAHCTGVPEDPESIGPQELAGIEDSDFCFKICPGGYKKVKVETLQDQFASIKAEICPGGNCICDDMVSHYADTVGNDEILQAAAGDLDAVCGGGSGGGAPAQEAPQDDAPQE
jgi:hypothetical protein